MASLLTKPLRALYRLRSRPLVAKRRGATFLLDPRNKIDNTLLTGAPFENEMIDYAKSAILRDRTETLIDIGANIGLYSVLRGLMPQIKEIYSFEPVRRNYNQLRANIFLNGLEAKFSGFELGLADANGEATIHIAPGATGISRIDMAGSVHKADKFQQSETIRLSRFDDTVRLPSDTRAFVKIDVEGVAHRVLAGMTDTLKRTRCTLQIELTEIEFIPALNILGPLEYRKTWSNGVDYIFQKDTVA